MHTSNIKARPREYTAAVAAASSFIFSTVSSAGFGESTQREEYRDPFKLKLAHAETENRADYLPESGAYRMKYTLARRCLSVPCTPKFVNNTHD